jgi:hypothetical protein
VQKPRLEGPAAYVLPASDPRPGAQAELVRILQRQHVEVSRATASFSVGMTRRPSAAAAAALDSASARRGDSASMPRPGAPPVLEARQFPAGSYIVRMDQPYSRIADALLDRQYWAPNDPQKTPYDDTGWSFPEGFAVQAERVTDMKVLDAPMDRVAGQVSAPGGVSGSGPVYAIDHNGDNTLATLRYRHRSADMSAAEEPFSAGGRKFARGSFVVRGIARDVLDRSARELGLSVVALDAAPAVKMHPVRAARVAILHTWLSTQTEGWWRYAFDQLAIPYDYISTQDIASAADLNAKYDVILFPPAGGSSQQIIEGLPRWRSPMPWKNTPLTPNIGTWAQTDDIRPGLGWQGVEKLQRFVARGGVFVGVVGTAEFATTVGFAPGVTFNGSPHSRVVGSLLHSTVVDATSPIVYGMPENLAVYSEGGETFSVSNTVGGRGGNRFGGTAERPTGRGGADDPDVVQGRPQLDSSNAALTRPEAKPWQAAPITRDQLRNPLNVIPPAMRPRVALRLGDQRGLLASGLLDGGSDIAQRPIVVDVPVDRGHVVLFANNPIWRGETIGSYFLVLNTLLNFDSLNAGRVLDPQ